MQYSTILGALALIAGIAQANPLPAPDTGSVVKASGADDVLAEAGAAAIENMAEGDYAIAIYSDGDCNDLLQVLTVRKNSCFSGSDIGYGWSSMKNLGGNDFWFGGTVTAYTTNSCGCPTCGSHGYDIGDKAMYADSGPGCLKDFGFVANAVGIGGF